MEWFAVAVSLVSLYFSIHVHKVTAHHERLDRLEKSYFQLAHALRTVKHFATELRRSAAEGTTTLSVTDLSIGEGYEAPILPKQHRLRKKAHAIARPIISLYEEANQLQLKLKRRELPADFGAQVQSLLTKVATAEPQLRELAFAIERERSRWFLIFG